MIQIEDIIIQFGDRKVLNNISATFNDGEIIGLVAPNGTGKSTLLNVLMNYLPPTSGKVIIGESLEYTSKSREALIRKHITMMADQSDLYPHLSGIDHLKIYADMWKETSIDPSKVVERLKMGHYVNNKTGTYSLGMKQRLCFAMQMVANTKYMLMDEVMNGLDPDNVELISKLLEEKKREGKVILIASHLLENLEKYADRILFLNDGHFVYERDYNKINNEDYYLKFSSRQNEDIVRDIHKEYPKINLKELSNERLIVKVNELSQQEIEYLKNIITEKYKLSYIIGPLDLLDHYSIEYNS